MRDPIAPLLRNLRSLDQLKRLVWQELNYDRVNQPLPTRDWSAEERALIVGDPVILAEHGDFKILFFQMPEMLNRSAERTLINRILQSIPYALFIFANAATDSWHFVNVKYERDARRRRVFRRITVVAGSDQLRTATERLSMLDLETVSRDLFGIPALSIQVRHDQAFDVEAVTAEFFQVYRKLFERVEQAITVLDKDERRLFTQKLFNRLLFLVFLERKGWLLFKGRTDYLRALWEDYRQHAAVNDEHNFYWNRLYVLFFSGLNNPHGLSLLPDRFPATVIGSVPYLNGGLFEQDDDDNNRNVLIPDSLFQSAIDDLFYRFNFTIAESTPLDIEVAVDPEMLGKIFEELVTGRHESGSYYTPKPVVSFMCREGLKGFLRANTAEEQHVITQFVDDYDSIKLRNPEATLDALRRVTVCDPACGSGAYLLGMLHELLLLRESLFKTRSVGARSAYDRKLEIIQRSIYGVDKEPFAINIAQLRLWLSLIVEYERQYPEDEIPTLPNLNYKLEVGDSLLGPDPSKALERQFDRMLVDQYVQAKAAYLKAHGKGKDRLYQEIEALKEQIRLWTPNNTHSGTFDWPVEFAEVFIDGGFDIVIANPPYVRQELIKDIKASLKQVFPETFNGTADLYTYFYTRAVQILRANGMIVFISSNKWFRANYGANLRRFLAEQTDVWSITDFGELPVFQTAATFPMIFVARKGEDDQQPTIFTQVKTLGDPYPDVAAVIAEHGQKLPEDAIRGETWTLSDRATAIRLRTMEQAGKTLGEYVGGKLYRGVLTGFNTAFVINDETRAALIAQDANSAEIIKPLAVGDDVRKWRIEGQNRWLIFTRRGIHINAYPAIKAHLQQWQDDLTPRKTSEESRGRKPGSYKWYEIQDDIAYFAEFDKPKIVFPDIAKESRFTFDTNGIYFSNTIYFIPVDDLYLLGLLNSNILWQYYRERMTVMGDANKGGRLRFFRQFVEQIPIPSASSAERNIIAALVQKCLNKQGIGCEAEEREIDERVARLYGVEIGEK